MGVSTIISKFVLMFQKVGITKNILIISNQAIIKKGQARDLSQVKPFLETNKMKKELSIDFEIGFADSNIQSYTIEGENLTLFLECWNSEIIEIKFLRFVSLFAMNYFQISDLQEVFESPILERALSELYEEKPKEHYLRIFKFLNSNKMTALEVVCEDIHIRKTSS